MRDFLDDIHAHREDGIGRAEQRAAQSLPKRFYRAAAVRPLEGGFSVFLDERAAKTPGAKPVVVPVEALAAAMATEWNAQQEVIDPRTMPLVRLVNSAVETGEGGTGALREEIVKYSGNDLLLYRADTPHELVAEQERLWDDALVRLARHFGIGFQPTIGIIHQPQPEATLARLREALAGEPLLALAALVSITTLTGSGLLALALRRHLLGADEVWAAAHVDEDFNIRVWGEDEEAKLRRDRRRREFDAAVRLLDLLTA